MRFKHEGIYVTINSKFSFDGCEKITIVSNNKDEFENLKDLVISIFKENKIRDELQVLKNLKYNVGVSECICIRYNEDTDIFNWTYCSKESSIKDIHSYVYLYDEFLKHVTVYDYVKSMDEIMEL